MKKSKEQHVNKIFVLKTDTLYGICARAFDKESVEKIYTIKGRDDNKPFIILIHELYDLKRFGIQLTSVQETFLKKHWPNPVSVVLSCNYKKYEYLHRGTKTLAFRLPNSDTLRNFIKQNGPIVAPSANPQGEKPAQTILQAKKYFGDFVDEYVDEGKADGKSSTVISLQSDGTYQILRKGRYDLI